jgi:hypothetical protein
MHGIVREVLRPMFYAEAASIGLFLLMLLAWGVR